MDLRNNGGGSFAESTLFSGLFIDQGPVLQVRYANKKIAVNSDTDKVSYYDGPLTILVNSHTAGAAEIFAGAMQDYERGIVLGERTFGLGTVQQHRGLGRIYDSYSEKMGSVQFAIAKYYRINGDGFQLRGVEPDVEFQTSNQQTVQRMSDEPFALPWDSIRAASYIKKQNLSNAMQNLKSMTFKAQDLEVIPGDPALSKAIAITTELKLLTDTD